MSAPLEDRRPALLGWFAGHARELPWRRDRRPYAVWVSEVMLQQTRAASAVPYFRHWMRTFPDVATLAAADEQAVLRAWEGLGYYRRARNLLRAARRVVERGAFPESEAEWRRLPGIGPYTAAAIAALAHGERTVAVDGNVRRLGARLLARTEPDDEELRGALRPLLPEDRPSRGTEALIELGARMCTPRSPDCESCPLAPACAARGLGNPEAFPRPRPRARSTERHRYARVHRGPDGIYLERREGDGLLGGLWGFPQEEARPEGTPLPPVRHAYTHLRLELTPVLASGAPPDGAPGGWFDLGAVERLPLSRVDRKVLAVIPAGAGAPP